MTAPTSDLGWMIRKLRNDQTTGLAFSQQVADALAAVAAERDQARQMLADAWDEGVSFGWHSTELRIDENPYREAGL